MRCIPTLLSAWVLAAAVPAGAQQWQSPVGGQPLGPSLHAPSSGQSITCESHNGAYQECAAPFRGRAQLAETLSSARCVEGQSWGQRGSGTVWVSGGCRARFTDSYTGVGGSAGVAGGSGVVRCESHDGRRQDCAAPAGGRLMLVRQLSSAACVEGQSWGSWRPGQMWVSNGCRGEFGLASAHAGAPVMGGAGLAGGRQVSCHSTDGRYHTCEWPLSWGRPQLLQQLSSQPCQESSTWGYDGHNGVIWVTKGCRGHFGLR